MTATHEQLSLEGARNICTQIFLSSCPPVSFHCFPLAKPNGERDQRSLTDVFHEGELSEEQSRVESDGHVPGGTNGEYLAVFRESLFEEMVFELRLQ